MKVIRTFLSALLVIGGLGSATLLSFGVGGCGGADEGGILVDGGDSSTTTPTGTTGGTTGATTGDEIMPPPGTTGSGTGEATGGETTGEATTGGEGTTGGDTTGGGETSGGSTYTLGEPPVMAFDISAPTVVSADINQGDNIIFQVVFSEPINFSQLSSKKSVILVSDAKLAAGALAAIFTFGAVDPLEAGTIPTTYLAGADNSTVYVVANATDVKKFRLKDSDGNWQASPYRLMIFGDDSTPASSKARAVADPAGNVLQHKYEKQFDCGSGKGKIPCGETVDIGTDHQG
ncbi:MAG TPA: hypothetical protein VFX30_06270 [bacterium]|nr:hypothetical protein [bacterium]